MTPIKKVKQYRKNQWRKVLSYMGDKILYEWRPAKKGWVEVRNLLVIN